MDYEKLISRGPDGPGDKERISLSVAEIVVRMVASGSFADHAGSRDPDAAIDGILMGLALVLEQAPEFTTPSNLRKATEDMGKRLHYHAKIARGMFEDSNVHPIAHILEGFGKTPSVN